MSAPTKDSYSRSGRVSKVRSCGLRGTSVSFPNVSWTRSSSQGQVPARRLSTESVSLLLRLQCVFAVSLLVSSSLKHIHHLKPVCFLWCQYCTSKFSLGSWKDAGHGPCAYRNYKPFLRKDSVLLKIVLKGKIRQSHAAARRGWNGWRKREENHVSVPK